MPKSAGQGWRCASARIAGAHDSHLACRRVHHALFTIAAPPRRHRTALPLCCKTTSSLHTRAAEKVRQSPVMRAFAQLRIQRSRAASLYDRPLLKVHWHCSIRRVPSCVPSLDLTSGGTPCQMARQRARTAEAERARSRLRQFKHVHSTGSEVWDAQAWLRGLVGRT